MTEHALILHRLLTVIEFDTREQVGLGALHAFVGPILKIETSCQLGVLVSRIDV